MRSLLVLRSPSHGTGWEDTWEFDGRDERHLRDCLDELGEFRTEPPGERWDPVRRRTVIDAADRWLAAMLLYTDEPGTRGWTFLRPAAEAAWTAAGARRLVQLLPDDLGDLRDAIAARFGP